MGDPIQLQRESGEQTDTPARALRQHFSAAGIFVVSLASSPGAGKTTLLEAVLKRLENGVRVAALVADPATSDDAMRLAHVNPIVKQINTADATYLTPGMICSAIDGWIPHDLEMLFIENVGNLVFPAQYDLGESHRVVLMSATEEVDTPLKYPAIFAAAHSAIITKMDLAKLAVFDLATARENLQKVNPRIEILETSTQTDHGVDEWIHSLRSRVERCRNDSNRTGAAG